MAKKKKDKGAGNATGKGKGAGKSKDAASKAKLPKTVAGVKVPKALRDAGGRLLETIQQPVVLEIAAAALIAAADGLRQGQKDKPQADGKDSGGGSKLPALLAAAAVEGIRKSAAAKPGSGKKS